MIVRLRLFHGPSIHAPFAAVMAEFTSPFQNELPASAIESKWRLLHDKPLWDAPAPSANFSFADLISALAVKLQHPDDPDSAKVRIAVGANVGPISIALGFIDPAASSLVLQVAIDLAEVIFQGCGGAVEGLVRLAPRLQQVIVTLGHSLPQTPIVRTLIREARRREIPVYPVAENSRIWMFGQGSAGYHFFEAASDRDSFTGMQLQRNKILSNRLVMRLGFPGVTHAVAKNKDEALRIALQLGYPVVVKPIDGGKGYGVSAYIVDAVELGICFTSAAAISPRGVIVERHVVGNDHRLAVFGGKLAWVATRHPASVVCDGRSSIAELIDTENRRRKDDSVAAGDGLLQLAPDQDMLQQLRKQGFSMESRPPQGTTAMLRSISNTSKGGSINDVTDFVHPDNVEMAEAIARGFRMDTLGIDFMTPDISRSWRDVPCAVIEVNGTPGIFFDSRVERILLAKFPSGSDGRIPSVLLIDAPTGMRARVSAILGSKGRVVGQASEGYTLLAGHARCRPGEGLPNGIMALISDPGCDALVIETSAESIGKTGLPLDRFDLALGFQAMPLKLRSLLQSCCVKVDEDFASETTLAPLLAEVLERYADTGQTA